MQATYEDLKAMDTSTSKGRRELERLVRERWSALETERTELIELAKKHSLEVEGMPAYRTSRRRRPASAGRSARKTVSRVVGAPRARRDKAIAFIMKEIGAGRSVTQMGVHKRLSSLSQSTISRAFRELLASKKIVETSRGRYTAR